MLGAVDGYIQLAVAAQSYLYVANVEEYALVVVGIGVCELGY